MTGQTLRRIPNTDAEERGAVNERQHGGGRFVVIPPESRAQNRTAHVTFRLGELEMPPMQDVLLVGRKAPIGPEAARRMVEAVAPGQYEILVLDHGPVEAVVIRRKLLDLFPSELLTPMLLEEAERLSAETLVIRGQVTVEILSQHQVKLP